MNPDEIKKKSTKPKTLGYQPRTMTDFFFFRNHTWLQENLFFVVPGSAGLPPYGGLSSGSEPYVSVECVHGDGTQPVPSSPWKQALNC